MSTTTPRPLAPPHAQILSALTALLLVKVSAGYHPSARPNKQAASSVSTLLESIRLRRMQALPHTVAPYPTAIMAVAAAVAAPSMLLLS